MNIQINGSPVGTHVLVGVILTICIIVLCYSCIRFYKRVGRRCRKKGCGSLHVRRISKIHLGPNETISLRSEEGKLRWWIRRVDKDTFSECLDCKHTEHVKTSWDQLSVIHAWWVRMTDKQQYEEDPRLNNIAYMANRDRLTRKHLATSENSVLTDTPPIKINRKSMLIFRYWRSFLKISQERLF